MLAACVMCVCACVCACPRCGHQVPCYITPCLIPLTQSLALNSDLTVLSGGLVGCLVCPGISPAPARPCPHPGVGGYGFTLSRPAFLWALKVPVSVYAHRAFPQPDHIIFFKKTHSKIFRTVALLLGLVNAVFYRTGLP